MYDIYQNNGIQYCSQNFNPAFLENGIVKKSYNSSSVNISNTTISGSEKDIEVYSTQSVTIGYNTTIHNGAIFKADYSNCPAE
jgi:hypothetical protein